MVGGRAAEGAEDENVLVGGVEHVEAYPVVIGEALGNDADAELLQRGEVLGGRGEGADFRDDFLEGWIFHSSIFNHHFQSLRSGELNEMERQGVHAVAKPGWPGTVVEYMAEMRVAEAARDRGARHAERKVADLAHVFLRNGLPEAGPAGARLEFGLGAEQGRGAANAAIEAFVVIVPIFAGIGAFRARMARYFERIGGQLLLPLGIRFDDDGEGNDFAALAGVGELDDFHFLGRASPCLDRLNSVAKVQRNGRNGGAARDDQTSTRHLHWTAFRILNHDFLPLARLSEGE